MKQVWSLIGVVALMSGCAVGSDPSGYEEPTGTITPGETPAAGADKTTSSDESNPNDKTDVVREHESEFTIAPQLIPAKPNHNGPIAPDPVVHDPDPAPQQ